MVERGVCHAVRNITGNLEGQVNIYVLAHQLIQRFGRLKDVLDAPTKELTNIKHVGESTAFFLQMLPDICRRYYIQGQSSTLDFSADDRGASFFIPYFLGRKQEVMYAAFLDRNFRILSCTLQYTGSASAVEIHLLDLLKEAKYHEACYVILAHNHFTSTDPSLQDIHCTGMVYNTLKSENVVLLDHMIVCDSKALSMRKSGHMNFLKR